jgi:hypothetical protein
MVHDPVAVRFGHAAGEAAAGGGNARAGMGEALGEGLGEGLAEGLGESLGASLGASLGEGRGAAAGATSAPPRAAAALLLLVLLSLPTLALLAFSLAPPINHDVAAILHYTERWLAGERLYADLFDINPPLVFIVTALPAALAAAAPISAIAAAQAAIVLLGVWCLWLCWRLAGRDVLPASPRFWVLAVLLPFLGLAFPVEMFGQREHLMLLTTLPYLLLAERRGASVPVEPRLEMTVALLAALGFALKPYFLALPLLVEAQLLLSLRLRAWSRSPTPWLLGAVWLAYGLVIVAAFPAYLTLVVPFAVGVYKRLDTSLLGAAFGLYGLPPLIGLLALSPFAFRRGASALSRLVALAACGAWLAAVAQGKGWPYHMLPAEALLVLLAGILGADLLARLLPREGLPRAGPPLAWLCLAVGFAAAAATREPAGERLAFTQGEVAPLSRLFAAEARGGKVLILSATLAPWFPALNYAGATMASRFMTMWMIQGSYRDCEPGERRYHALRTMSRAERYAFRAIAADLVDHRPKLVVVDSLTGIEPCGGRDFDFLAYAMRSPSFAHAFSQYDRIASPLDRLRVYRLREEGAAQAALKGEP